MGRGFNLCKHYASLQNFLLGKLTLYILTMVQKGLTKPKMYKTNSIINETSVICKSTDGALSPVTINFVNNLTF